MALLSLASNWLESRTSRVYPLPFSCLGWLGAELLREALPPRRYHDRVERGPDGAELENGRTLDPLRVLMRTRTNVEPLMERQALLPEACWVFSGKNAQKKAVEVLDLLTREALGLVQACERYRAAFPRQLFRDEETGRIVEREQNSVSDKQARYKSVLRADVQRAFLRYQWQQLQRLKRLVANYVFKSQHPGLRAVAVADPSLSFYQVRIPMAMWPTFQGGACDALVLRHPVLKSMYWLRPVPGTDAVVGLNPYLARAINLDHDGDTLLVMPIPRELSGQGDKFATEPEASDSLVLECEEEWRGQNRPLNVPPLSLPDLLGEQASLKFVTRDVVLRRDINGNPVKTGKVRSAGPLLLEPLTFEQRSRADMEAAGRFCWEKTAIGPTDSVRRALAVILADEPAEVLEAAMRFTARASQDAIDAGKHHRQFDLSRYLLAFRNKAKIVDDGMDTGKQVRFKASEQLAGELAAITGGNWNDALVIARALYKWQVFRQKGLWALLETHFPWWAFVQNDSPMPSGTDPDPNARILLNLETAVASDACLLW